MIRRLLSKRFVRILLWLFATLVTLYILLFVWTDWSGRRRWAAVKTTLEREGETLDFRKLLPETPPDAQNLMAIEPLRGIAVIVDNDEAKGEPGAKRKALADMKWSDRTPPVSNGVAMGQAADLQEWVKFLRETKYLELPTAPAASAREVLTALDAKLPLLKQIADEAAKRPLAVFTPGIHERKMPELLFTLRLPHYPGVQTLARALALRARTAVAAGESAEATRSILAIQLLATACKQEALLIGFLVGNTMEMVALEPLWLGLREHAFAEDDLRRLQEAFGSDQRTQALLLAMRGELAAGLNAVEFLQIGASGRLPMDQYLTKALSADGTLPPRLLGRGVPGGLFDHWKSVAAEMELRYLIQPLKKGSLREAVRRGEEATANLQRNSNVFLHPDYIMARLMLPAVSRVSSQTLLLEARQRQALAALALERFFVKHAKYPAALTELTPDFLPAVPLDPCDEKPLRYRTTPTGRYQLWSVGLDSKDDGGKVKIRPVSMSSPDYLGDWTWSYEPVK